MSVRTSRRLRRYAFISALCLAVYVVGLLLDAASAWFVVLIASVPFVLAWGPFQAEVAMNPEFGDAERRRWRIVLFVLPWSMTLYWYRYVRGAGVGE